jgi:AraC-like DNA-binding protein
MPVYMNKKGSIQHSIRNMTVGGRSALLDCKRLSCPSRVPGFAVYKDFTPDYFGVNYVIVGCGTYVDSKGLCVELKPGSLFHRFPSGAHSTSMQPGGYDEFCLTFDVQTFYLLRSLGVVQDHQAVFQLEPSDLIIRKFEQYRDCLKDEALSAGELMVEAQQLLMALYKLARPKGQERDALIRRAREILSSELERRMPVCEAARELGVGYHAFRRIFREKTGSAPADYRIRRRIDRACELLAICTVQETSLRLGYPDPFTFSEQFKKITGMPPRRYRDMLFRRDTAVK